MFSLIRVLFSPKQTTPGLLLFPGEHRDNALRLAEWDRRKRHLYMLISEIPEGADMYGGDDDSEEEREKRQWWMRTARVLYASHARHIRGTALQARLYLDPGAPKLCALVYELHIQNTLRNKRSIHRRLLRSIK